MIQTICVCGAGTMGSGIAQIAAQSGFYTILYDPDGSVLAKAKLTIESNLQALAEKRRIGEDEKDKIVQRIFFSDNLHHCVADMIIEAVVERIETKVALFNQLAEINHSDIVFATNTSSLPVTVIAEKVVNPQRVIGMHFFNPAPLMKLVEIVNTKYTAREVTGTVKTIAKEMGKMAVVCNDAPGFIVNRVARPYYIESLRLVEENISSIENIDSLLEATGFRMGPFKLMDLIGNDINYAVSTSVYRQLDRPERLRPSSIQKEKVDRGELGRKTGKGYYDYP